MKTHGVHNNSPYRSDIIVPSKYKFLMQNECMTDMSRFYEHFLMFKEILKSIQSAIYYVWHIKTTLNDIMESQILK